jgi:hypothetical protein
MQEGFYEPLGQKSLDALTRIRSNGKHLLGLINTMLDFSPRYLTCETREGHRKKQTKITCPKQLHLRSTTSQGCGFCRIGFVKATKVQ